MIYNKPLSVLVVEDSPSDALWVKRALEKSTRRSFQIYEAASIHEAEVCLYHNPIDVIVLDLALPDSRKKDTLLWMLRQTNSIVVTTSNDDDATISEAFRHGAQDYLVKGDFTDKELSRCVIYAVERSQMSKDALFFKLNLERIVSDRVKEALATAGKLLAK